MADRVADPTLYAAERVPAPARQRQAVHRPAGQLLGLGRVAPRTLMAGLGAPLAPVLLALGLLARQLPALLTRQRRIGRRRHRAVTRIATRDTLKLLHALAQTPHLGQQRDNQLTRRLPAGYRNRFSLLNQHERKVPCTQKESCSRPRHPVNTYVPLRDRCWEIALAAQPLRCGEAREERRDQGRGLRRAEGVAQIRACPENGLARTAAASTARGARTAGRLPGP
jgi:hypothetical protein